MSPRFISGERTLRRPTQARSIASRERLLDAAELLFGERGYENTSVAQIAEEAHSSIGVFYNRFSDKAEIFRAVQQRVLESLLAMWAAALERARSSDNNLPKIVTGVVIELAQFISAERLFLRAIATRNVADAQVGAVSRSIGRLLVGPLSQLLLEQRVEIAHWNPELAVDVGFRMVYATLQQTVLYGDERPTEQETSSGELAHELARAFLAYLTQPHEEYGDECRCDM